MSRRVRCAPLLFSLTLLIVVDRNSVLHADAPSSFGACISGTGTSGSTVTLHLVDRVGLPREVLAELMRETTQLWRAAGVRVEWSALPPAGTEVPVVEGQHPPIMVIVTPDMPDALRSAPPSARVMASILFIDGKPTTLIGAYPAEVTRLLETMRMEVRPINDRPAALRHRLMGRVLGRAIAHELGHFLYGSADHAQDGLMRARHRVDDLTSPFRHAFRVDPSARYVDSCVTITSDRSPVATRISLP